MRNNKNRIPAPIIAMLLRGIGEHLHSVLKYITPHQRHAGEAARILAERRVVYLQAKAKTPERWSGEIRNFNLPDEVYLNPENKSELLKNSN